MKNKFPVILIVLFIIFTVYTINFTYVKVDSSRQNSTVFSSLVGELKYELRPYQINHLKRRYIKLLKEVDKAKKSSIGENSKTLANDEVSDGADTESTVKSIYSNQDVSSAIKELNSLLNSYSIKYLKLPEEEIKDNTKSIVETIADEPNPTNTELSDKSIRESQLKIQENQMDDLKDILSKQDYAQLEQIVTEMNDNSSQLLPETQIKILQLLSQYKDLNSYIILNQLCMKFDVLAYYELEGDVLVPKPLTGVSMSQPTFFEQEKYKSLIEMQLKLLEDVHKKYFNGFFIFKDNDKTQLAYAGDFQNNQRAFLGIDAQDFANVSSNEFERNRFYESTVKELVKVIFLSSNQVDYSKSDGILDKDDFISIKSYAKKNSYIQLFYDRFYTDLLYEDALASQKSGDDATMNSFYLRHYYDYMSPVQAYDPFTDMTQSLVHFILDDIPEQNNIKEQKVKFFYEFTELSDIRNKVQLNIKNMEE